jgi:hypothetical protein
MIDIIADIFGFFTIKISEELQIMSGVEWRIIFVEYQWSSGTSLPLLGREFGFESRVRCTI